MERKQKIAYVVLFGVLSLLMVGFYLFNSENTNTDEIVLPETTKSDYDNKLEEYRKAQGKRPISNIVTTFTEADSIERDGKIIANPIKTKEKQREVEMEREVEQMTQKSTQAINRLTQTVNKINNDEDSKIKYYQPKGERITYKNGKAYVGGKELEKDEPTESETLPVAFEKLQQVVDDTNEGSPKSYSAPEYDFSVGVIPCVVHTTQVVKNGSIVLIRATKETTLGGVKIPKNTILSANVRYNNDRVNLTIKAIKLAGNFYTVNLIGLGDDGQEGLPLSSSVQLKAVEKELTSSVINEAGTVLSSLGTAGKVVGSVARGLNSATRNQKEKEIKLINNQKINFLSYEN